MNIRRFIYNVWKDEDGIWRSKKHAPTSKISYPKKGNTNCFKIEDSSFWFKHRNECILACIKKFSPPNKGPIFDLGGGNGIVSKMLIKNKYKCVLIEPGRTGIENAYNRGCKPVIWATENSLKWKKETVSAYGLFDVLEHMQEPQKVLKRLYISLKDKGTLYITVPAYRFLWSHVDEISGHFIRYTPNSISKILNNCGFEVLYKSSIFSWLIAPIFLLRVLPSKIQKKNKLKANYLKIKRDHLLPLYARKLVTFFADRELSKIKNLKAQKIGSSLICVARKKAQ